MEISINNGRIREYDVNVKLEHKTYGIIYSVLLELSREDKKIGLRNIEYLLKNSSNDWKKIADEFWKNKDKDIVN